MDDEILYSARANLLAVVSLTRQLDTLPLVMYYKRRERPPSCIIQLKCFTKKEKRR
jgi:hypothetical protein